MAKINNFQLPEFELEKLLEHLDSLVAAAKGGVVRLVVDLFCGAGGTSEGIENALFNSNKCSSIIVGINHDKKAIYSQSINHPLAYYTDEDIRFANLVPIQKKFIGNAVPPKVAQAIAESMYSGLVEYIINKIAA